MYTLNIKIWRVSQKSEVRNQKLEISSILCPLSSVLKFSILWLRVCPLCRKATVEEGVGKKPQGIPHVVFHLINGDSSFVVGTTENGRIEVVE